MKLSYSLKEIKRLIKPELRWVLSASNTSNGEKKTEKYHYHLCRIPSQQSLASWMYQAEEAWSLGSFQPLPLFGVRCMDCRLNFPTSFHCTNQEESTRTFFHKYSVCMPAIRNRRIWSHYADYRSMVELLLGHKILKTAGRIQNLSRSWKMWVGNQTRVIDTSSSLSCVYFMPFDTSRLLTQEVIKPNKTNWYSSSGLLYNRKR